QRVPAGADASLLRGRTGAGGRRDRPRRDADDADRRARLAARQTRRTARSQARQPTDVTSGGTRPDSAVLRVLHGAPEHDELAAAVLALLAVSGRARGVESCSRRAPGWTPHRGYCPPGAWTSG